MYLSDNKAHSSQGLEDDSEDSNVTGPWHVGHFQVILDSHPPLGPIIHLLVFYIGDDGEVVADSRKFRIKKCLENQVKFEYKYEQQYPGSLSPIVLVADPFSYCGVTAVDKSVHLLKTDFDVTKSKVFEVLQKLDLNRDTFPKQVSEDHCKTSKIMPIDNTSPQKDLQIMKELLEEFRKKRSMESSWLELIESLHVDSVMAFEETGVLVISDFKMEVRPCFKTRFPDFPLILDSDPGVSRIRYDAPDSGDDPPVQPSVKPSLEVRNYFPETWLWEIVTVGESGNVILPRELPHTITEWIGNAFCVSPTTGIGVSEISTVKTFQPFFIDLTLPYSVIRGEILPVIVTVFNYLEETLSVKITLEGTEKLKTVNGSSSYKMCISGFKSNTHRFYVKPQIIGYTNLTVYGYALQDEECGPNGVTTANLDARDSLTKPLLVEPEGFLQEKVESIFFCPSDYDGGVFHHEFQLFLPEDVVKGSEYAKISVSGDIMGPTVHGLEKLIHLPVGCGEQNMVLFVPNIFILDYLLATNQGTDSIKEKAISYMKTGYQRELTYRHGDGSYSAFGEMDKEGSLWLTAFVVKSFSEARKFIPIDHEDLHKSIEWILEKQMENGCFPKIGTLLRQQLKGGLQKKEATLAPLTAYVMIALLESGVLNSTQVVENGFFCLMAETHPDPYELALFAYAAVLGKHPIADDYLNQLEKISKTTGEIVYWSDETVDSPSVQIEIASYVVLSLMAQNSSANLAKALPIVRWIVQQRNPNGGFVSTQDTVVALQALSVYSSHATQKTVDLSLFVEADELHHSFSISNDNMLLMQAKKFPVLPTIVDMQSVGDGCAFAQVFLKYNVPTTPENATFGLQVVSKWDTIDCNYLILDVCYRYIPMGRVSNMAVLQLHMLSGYVPDETSLFQLQHEGKLNWKRYELTGNVIHFYYDEISNEENCFHLKMKKEINIENLQPAVAKIYDYYQPEFFSSVTYLVSDHCDPFSNLSNSPENMFGNVSGADATVESFLQRDHLLEPTVEDLTNFSSSEARNGSLSHLDNFVNLDFEQDFPEGLEGNHPVIQKFPPSAKNMSECPECFTSYPHDFAELYCLSLSVLMVQIRSTSEHRMKLIQDLSPFKTKVENRNIFLEYLLPDFCECIPLDTVHDYALILRRDSPVERGQLEKLPVMILQTGTTVIAGPTQDVLRQQVKKAKKMCSGIYEYYIAPVD